jgi:meiotically up-regulated gene 157 (Mug157) protein
MVSQEVEEIAEKVMEEHGQSEEVKQQFLNFYENTIDNNLGGNDLKSLINTIELSEEEKLDGS